MMNEKRFELDVRLDMPKLLIDNATNRRYHLLLVNDIEEIVDILNRQEEKIRRLEYMLSKQCYCVKLDGVLNDGEQQSTINKLREELAICQQSKNDDSRFQVWEVPPIPKGTRITFSTTTERSDKNE